MKILVATINPCPKITKPAQNIFEAPQIVELDKMFIYALGYALGSEATEFIVEFGDVITVDNIQKFNPIKSERIVISSDELSTWGVDDVECYNIIAQKLGVNCTSFETVNQISDF